MSEYSESVQFIDLKAQQELIRQKLDTAIANVLDHGQYIMGPEVKSFEADLRAFTSAQIRADLRKWHRCPQLGFNGMGYRPR